jgi:hypothetical protein
MLTALRGFVEQRLCVVFAIQRAVMTTHMFDRVAHLMGVTSGMDNFKGRANNLALPASSASERK